MNNLRPGEWKIEFRLRPESGDMYYRYGQPNSHPIPHRGDTFTIEDVSFDCEIVHVDYDRCVIRVWGKQL